MYINYSTKYLIIKQFINQIIKQNYLKISLYFVITILFIANIYGCANIQAPSGGPRDTIPPNINEISPPNFQNNFTTEQFPEITISFDKYMDKGKVVENIFVSPETKLKYNWSGKKLEISFLDTLLPQTTYTLNLGAEYTDFLGNKPQESFTYVFSTGEKIDKGVIDGQVVDKSISQNNNNDKNSTNLYVFAYKIDDSTQFKTINQLKDRNNSKSDSIFIKPNYQTQVGKDGNFNFSGLKAGKYIITAIDDKYKDKKFDLGIDRIGLSNNIIEINDSLRFTTNIKLGSIIDITPPILNSSEFISNNRVSVNFSENIDPSNLSNYSAIITDSALNEVYLPLSILPNNQKPNKIDIILSQKLDTNKIWKVVILNTNNFDKYIELTQKVNLPKEFLPKEFLPKDFISDKIIIRDTSQNKFNDSINYSLFKPESKSNEEFQLPVVIVSNVKNNNGSNQTNDYELKDSSEIKDLNFGFILKSNYSLSDSIVNFINFTQNNKSIKLISEKKAANIYFLYSENKLDLNNKYQISYNSRNLIAQENKIINDIKIKDTTININFSTPKTNKLSFLSGKFIRKNKINAIEADSLINQNINYILKFTNETSKKESIIFVKNNAEFKVENLESGTYSIEIIEDRNNNNIFDGGYFDIFGNIIFSEKFLILKDNFKIKQNWDIEDFIINAEL